MWRGLWGGASRGEVGGQSLGSLEAGSVPRSSIAPWALPSSTTVSGERGGDMGPPTARAGLDFYAVPAGHADDDAGHAGPRVAHRRTVRRREGVQPAAARPRARALVQF